MSSAHEKLLSLGLAGIKELESERGILASGRSEMFGCLFGRDSLIVALELMGAAHARGDAQFLSLIRKVLLNLSMLQGSRVVIDSGEEPGKIIHEYRPEGHEHLTAGPEQWYLYPDGIMRNYDSVDSTPLYLMAMHEYLLASGDKAFIEESLPHIEAALQWLLIYADSNGDGLVDYQFHPERLSGGLKTQSWMDSKESVFFEHKAEQPVYPIAPVEVQAYAWAALRAWSDYFADTKQEFAHQLYDRAAELKKLFNERYVLKGPRSLTLAFAIDGPGEKLAAPRSSMGHVLWALYKGESILEKRYIPLLRNRLLARDLFAPKAGIRTLSMRSLHFDPVSYHNGSIWPHDTALLALGLARCGFDDDAKRVRAALINAYEYYQTPIELFGYSRGFKEYKHPDGAGACRMQAWSAAALISIVSAS